MATPKRKVPEVFPEHENPPDIPQDLDVGASLAKDRAGPIREKYPVTEGAANFSSMAQRAREAVDYATAAEDSE